MTIIHRPTLKEHISGFKNDTKRVVLLSLFDKVMDDYVSTSFGSYMHVQ